MYNDRFLLAIFTFALLQTFLRRKQQIVMQLESCLLPVPLTLVMS